VRIGMIRDIVQIFDSLLDGDVVLTDAGLLGF